METELVSEVISKRSGISSRQAAEHTITVTSTDDLLLARMDARLIVQVIINLVNNAIKYTQKGSRIQILTDKLGSDVRIQVTDDGPGIPDEAKPLSLICAIPAQTALPTAAEPGTRGSVCAAPSSGPTAEIFPFSDNTPLAVSLPLHYPARRWQPMNKPLILVVEDDAPIHNLITTTLKLHDYRFLTAANGETALMEASSHNPDIILLDLGLPDIDGIDIIRQIRSWA